MNGDLKYITKFFRGNFVYFFIILLTLSNFFYFSNYYYYKGDQTTQLPAILNFFDNELYQKDLEMQMLNPMSVKMIPHLILFSISKITTIPTYIIYVGAYLLVSFFIFFLVYKISFLLFSSKYAGLLASILVLFINKTSVSIAGFNIITSAVNPYFISVPFHLLCFYLVLQNRYKLSILISASLFYIHGQNSMFAFIAILSVIIFFKKDIKLAVKSVGIYLALISPMLVSLFSNFNPLTNPVARYSILQLVKFAIPYHHLPGLRSILKFVGLIFSIILLLYVNNTNKKYRYWNYALILISFIGIIFTKFMPVDAIFMLYLLRVDVFLRIFFVILFSGAIFKITKVIFGGRDILTSIIKNKYKIAAVMLIMLFSVSFFFNTPSIRYPNIKPKKDSLTDISDYIKSNTPKDSLIIASPSIQGVRLYTKRSNVVDLKTNPIGRGNKIQDEWVDRLASLCNVKESNSDVFQEIRNCKYNSLSKWEYRSLCRKYDADYFITKVNNKYWDDILIYNNNVFGLYKCEKNDYQGVY